MCVSKVYLDICEWFIFGNISILFGLWLPAAFVHYFFLSIILLIFYYYNFFWRRFFCCICVRVDVFVYNFYFLFFSSDMKINLPLHLHEHVWNLICILLLFYAKFGFSFWFLSSHSLFYAVLLKLQNFWFTDVHYPIVCYEIKKFKTKLEIKFMIHFMPFWFTFPDWCIHTIKKDV